IGYLSNGRKWLKVEWLYFINIIILPILFLLYDSGQGNIYDDEVAVFAPAHRLTLYVLVGCCIVAYYASLSKRTKGPLAEVIVNCFLLIGILLNLILMYHLLLGSEAPLCLYCIPNACLFTMRLAESHKKIINQTAEANENENSLLKACRTILHRDMFQKVPILLVFSLPLLCIVSAVLLLFGQEPYS